MPKSLVKTPPRLSIDLIPHTAWESNVRTRYPGEWDFFRRACYRSANYRCETCEAQGKLECHEVWNYSSPPFQKLDRLICLCPLCHLTQHYGLASIKNKTIEVDAHLRLINGWTQRQVISHVKKAFEIWDQRNKIQWQTTTEILDSQAIFIKNNLIHN